MKNNPFGIDEKAEKENAAQGKSYLEKLGLSEELGPYAMFAGKMPKTVEEALWVSNMAEAAMQGLLARPFDENDSTTIGTACWKFALMALDSMPTEIRDLLEDHGFTPCE